MRFEKISDLFLFFLSFLFCANVAWPDFFSTVYEMPFSDDDRNQTELIWEITETEPFNELIFSWNASRSPDSRYIFFVSLRQNGEWSPWLYYGDWGDIGQALCVESPPDSLAMTNRGVASPKKGTCDGFRLQILAQGVKKLLEMNAVSASLANLTSFYPRSIATSLEPILLENVPRQSLHTLRLPRHWDMSMVASTLSAIRYLGKMDVDAFDLAAYVMDNDFESYDFWPLHAAEAFHRLKGQYQIRVERLFDFSVLHAYLMKKTPVLVNIQGTPLGGMPWPSYRSHILCVIGYDPSTQNVTCLDPAFPSDKSTYVNYALDDFLRVWAKRQNIACVFELQSDSDTKICYDR